MLEGVGGLILVIAGALLFLVAAAAIGWLLWRNVKATQEADTGPPPASAEDVLGLLERMDLVERELRQLNQQVQREVPQLRGYAQRLADDLRVVAERMGGGPTPAPERQRVLERKLLPPEPAAPDTSATDALMRDYREAAEDLVGAGEAFMERRQPIGVAWSAADNGWRSEGEARTAFLWAVRLGREYLIVPGYRAIKDWRTHFAPQREQNAADHFGAAFDLDPAPGRFDVTPAQAQAEGNVLRLKARGAIRGFRG